MYNKIFHTFVFVFSCFCVLLLITKSHLLSADVNCVGSVITLDSSKGHNANFTVALKLSDGKNGSGTAYFSGDYFDVDAQKKHKMSRLIMFNFKRKSTDFYLNDFKIIAGENDDLVNIMFQRELFDAHPEKYFRLEKLSNGAFLISNVFSPILVCLSKAD